jgi:hypothetical protein
MDSIDGLTGPLDYYPEEDEDEIEDYNPNGFGHFRFTKRKYSRLH